MAYNEDTNCAQIHIPLPAHGQALARVSVTFTSSKFPNDSTYSPGRLVASAPALVLLDSGAVGAYVSKSFVDKHSLVLEALDNPIELTLADGHASAPITHRTSIDIRMHMDYPSYAKVQVEVVDLHDMDIILGSDWMIRNHVDLQFSKSRVEFPWVENRRLLAIKAHFGSRAKGFAGFPKETFPRSAPNNILLTTNRWKSLDGLESSRLTPPCDRNITNLVNQFGDLSLSEPTLVKHERSPTPLVELEEKYAVKVERSPTYTPPPSSDRNSVDTRTDTDDVSGNESTSEGEISPSSGSETDIKTPSPGPDTDNPRDWDVELPTSPSPGETRFTPGPVLNAAWPLSEYRDGSLGTFDLEAGKSTPMRRARRNWPNRILAFKQVPRDHIYASVSDELEDPRGPIPHPYESWAEFDEESVEIRSIVPECLQHHINVFRRKRGKETLPEHREYDHEIVLEPGKRLPVAKLYPLSIEQKTVLREYLDAETKSGRVRPSKSPYGSPCFFVPKKDGKLRLVVDYRTLNEATRKNVYPLPRIDQIYGEFATCSYFCKLDLVGAYQLLRIKEGDEYLTAFRTHYGMFESLVMRDGLCNAPASFQSFLSEVLREYLGLMVHVYIDDIVIGGTSKDDLNERVSKVLGKIAEYGLYLNATKCEFERTSIVFLGHVLSAEGISADPSRIAPLIEMSAPTSLEEGRRVMGTLGYYRRFVPDYAKLAGPIYDLFKGKQGWAWTKVHDEAFANIKYILAQRFLTRHFHHGWVINLYVDSSEGAWGCVISQIDPGTGIESPIAFHSAGWKGSELNHHINDKEFHAISLSFDKFREYLLNSVETHLYTDSRNALAFLNAGPNHVASRQRWALKLSQYTFTAHHLEGKRNYVADALSRDPRLMPKLEDQPVSNYFDLLPGFREMRELSESSPIFDGGSTPPHPTPGSYDRSIKQILRVLSTPSAAQAQESREQRELLLNNIARATITDTDLSPLYDEMRSLICYKPCNHVDCKRFRNPPSYYRYIPDPRRHQDDGVRWGISGNTTLYINGRLAVPNSNEIRLEVMQKHHDDPLAIHGGQKRTYESIAQAYYWKGMKEQIYHFVSTCLTCLRTKSVKLKPQGHLKSLTIAQRPFQHISMDYIVQLPMSDGYDAILVVVDRFSKFVRLFPTTVTLNATGLIELLKTQYFHVHGYPESITADRDTKHTSVIFKGFCRENGIDLNLSTAYHPQTDGQSERMVQYVEGLIRAHPVLDFLQTNWSTILGDVTFAINRSYQSAHGLQPYEIVYGHACAMPNDRAILDDNPTEVRTRFESRDEIYKYVTDMITDAQATDSKYYDYHRRSAPKYNPGDKVMLNASNIKTIRPSKKLDFKRLGPFEVIEMIGTHAVRLLLPATMKIHNVFHVGLLEKYSPSTIPDRSVPELPGPIVVDGEDEYEVSKIVNSRTRGKGKNKRVQYFVEWEGYKGTEEEYTWEEADDLANAKEKVMEFHKEYPKSAQSPIFKKTKR